MNQRFAEQWPGVNVRMAGSQRTYSPGVNIRMAGSQRTYRGST